MYKSCKYNIQGKFICKRNNKNIEKFSNINDLPSCDANFSVKPCRNSNNKLCPTIKNR